jgi:hypothetical protein
MIRRENSAKIFVVKQRQRFKFDEVRQRLRLTPTETRVALFVAAAFVLGLVTKCYRGAHPSSAPAQTHSGTMPASASSQTKADRPRALKTGKTTRRLRKSVEALDLSDSAMQQERQ